MFASLSSLGSCEMFQCFPGGYIAFKGYKENSLGIERFFFSSLSLLIFPLYSAVIKVGFDEPPRTLHPKHQTAL